MTLPDKTKRQTLFLTATVLFISWIVGYFYLEYQFKVSVTEQYQSRYTSVEKFFYINLEHEKQKLGLELEKIVLMDGISEAVNNSDYKKLDSIITPYYKEFTKFHTDIEILTFHIFDGSVLYHAHMKDLESDKLNDKRELIVDTSRLKKSLSGFEVANLEITYRITQPIFHKGTYVGDVEIGLDPMHFMNNLSNVFTMQMGVALDKNLLDATFDSQIIPIKDNYVLLKSTEEFKQFFIHNSKLNIDSFNNEGVVKVKMDIPLTNHLSEVLGYLVIGFDTTDLMVQKKNFIYKLLFLMIIMSLLMGYVLHKGFKKMLKYFTEQVYTDQLTGLKNRAALNDKLSSNKTCILVLSDIKDFSIINELYGVEIGNEVLVQFSKAFCTFASQYKYEAFRISSDEFVMLKQGDCPDTKVKCTVMLDALHKMVHQLDIKINSIHETIKVDIHSGITFDHKYSLEEAQMALKKAKENSLAYLAYSEHVDTKERAQKLMETRHTIRYALESFNVVPFFQPITDIDGKFIKYEALARILVFEHGKKRILYPDSFLEISKQNTLYVEIAKRVIRQSLVFFSSREEQISINLYPSDFFNSLIVGTIVECIEKYNLQGRVVIEILEQENLGDFERVLEAINKLRKIGVLIAIDDFGSGYSNYTHILKIKPDYLKIDASLIQNIVTNDESKILVKSIVNFAKDLNITTIAEYVESQEIFELLKEYGVDEFQGYYFSKPIDLLSQTRE